jgi:hypothetical protein
VCAQQLLIKLFHVITFFFNSKKEKSQQEEYKPLWFGLLFRDGKREASQSE